ncbi:hypothetical protein RB596_001200 [Gaeumannomyces avenae]
MVGARQIRTLPPWIESYSPRLGAVPSAERLSPLEPQLPPTLVLPQHNSLPAEPKRPAHSSGSSTNNRGASRAGSQKKPQQADAPGQPVDGYADSSQERLQPPLKNRRPRNLQQFFTGKGPSRWDHLRSADPVIVPNRAPESQQSWRDFITASHYGGNHRGPHERSEVVDDAFFDRLQPGLNDPVRLPSAGGSGVGAAGVGTSKRASAKARARAATPFLERLLLIPVRHPLGPLFSRLIVLSTSIVALALSATIVQEARRGAGAADGGIEERGQAIFAIAVDSVAIPYIGYITWDDHMGKPLGLRLAKERVKLILMDLFFIMFKAASTGLAFETLIYSRVHATFGLLRALAAFELIGLVSWATTLIANVFRVVERLGG